MTRSGLLFPALADIRKSASPQRRTRAAFAALALALAAAASHATLAATPEENRAREALAHATAIETAFNQLSQHILRDSLAATTWTGATPPTATGWQAAWTARGLGARYCGNVLVVHATRDSLKGVGEDQRSVRVAAHLQSTELAARPAPLHWLAGGIAEGELGRESVTIPACMTGIPTGRVALAGTVVDPFTVRTEVIGDRETEVRACPAGTHGPGQTWERELLQDLDGRGDAVGAPRPQPWQLQVDDCTGDYTEWEFYRQECTFWADDPHNAMLTGQQVWRRLKSVTADGTSFGAPEFVSTTCWDNPDPAPPVVTETTETVIQSRAASCEEGYEGAVRESRRVTRRLTTFPWDAEPTESIISATAWEVVSHQCVLKAAEEDGENAEEDTGEDAEEDVCINDQGRTICAPPSCSFRGRPGEKVAYCPGPDGRQVEYNPIGGVPDTVAEAEDAVQQAINNNGNNNNNGDRSDPCGGCGREGF